MTSKIFRSTQVTAGSPGYPERSGQLVEVVTKLTDDVLDRVEVGDMFRIRFADGVETDAFADELLPELSITDHVL